MLKIFSTQLSGYFKKIAEQEEIHIEDGARLLAQAAIGSGAIYIHGVREMGAVTLEAIYGEEPLSGARALFENGKMADITPADRIILVTRFSTDEKAIALAQKLQEQGHMIVGISALKEGAQSLEQFTDVHIDTKLLKALIPDEEGSRYGFPSAMTALFTYYGLAFTIKEILAEYT
ncbi:MAG: DUF2529 domain-containing protein [Ectobacillus sp.]